jgi:hypothetical protein
MRLGKQVDKAHYRLGSYLSKSRWISLWHQLDEIQRLTPESVLEIGPGPGLLKMAAQALGIRIETLDYDPELKPDYVGSLAALPFHDGAYDVVCAFQVLEHVPYDHSLQGFAEMARVARRQVVISLPDAREVWRYVIHLPGRPAFEFLLPKPRLRAPENRFNGEHHWELNKAGYPLSRVLDDFARIMPLSHTYRVPEMPYHRFMVFAWA